MPSDADTTGEFHAGFAKIHIPHPAARAPVDGQWTMGALVQSACRPGAATVYPLLGRMSEAGYLEHEGRMVGGRVRKHDRATERGSVVRIRVRVRARKRAGDGGESPGAARCDAPTEETPPGQRTGSTSR